MRRRVLAIGMVTCVCVAAVCVTGEAQFGGWSGDPGERKLVARFDADGDGRLNSAERRKARDEISSGNGGGSGWGGGWRSRRGGAGGGAAVSPGKPLKPSDIPPPYPTTPLYDLPTLRTAFLEFENSDWEDELAAFHDTDVEVSATLTIDGRTYRDVGVHFRGASSYSMVPAGLKRSLNLSLDFVHDKQDFNSYQSLNLQNSANDPTFLRTVLYTEIARHYIPIPRANHLRVVINGESWGIYINTQQFNNDFIRDVFGRKGGTRWKAPGSPGGRAGFEYLGEDLARYRRLYEIKGKDDPEAWAALVRLCKVLNETPPDALEAALAPMLDIDGALKFLALEVALVNSDGYWARASDYNLYRAPDGRFHIIPHDVNEALADEGGGGRYRSRTGAELDPLVGLTDASKPLRSRLLAVPALRERYMGYIRDIAGKWLDWNTLGPIVQASHRLIADDVRRDTRKLDDIAGFDAAVAATNNPLKAFVDRRRAFLLGQ